MNSPTHLSPFLSPRTAQSACIPRIDHDLATTMVQIADIPAEFIGGNIGRLAVNIAANRLLAAGAVPRYGSFGVTIDTDTPVNTLNAIARAMQQAAVDAEMEWTACNSGFTPSGPATGVALSMFALGQLHPDFATSPSGLRPADSIIVTSPVGTLGTAIEATRRGEPAEISHSDGFAMLDAINSLFDVDPDIHYMTLAERGLNTVISTIAADHPVNFLREAVPILPSVAETASRLGLDPLDLHCSSAIVIAVSQQDTDKALAALRRTASGSQAAVIATIGS